MTSSSTTILDGMPNGEFFLLLDFAMRLSDEILKISGRDRKKTHLAGLSERF